MLDHRELRTFITEQGVVPNSQPLVYVSEDADSPSVFPCGQMCPNPPQP